MSKDTSTPNWVKDYDSGRKDAVPTWVEQSDPKGLKNELDKLIARLEWTRKEPSKYSPTITIYASIGIFVAIMIGVSYSLASTEESVMTNLFQDLAKIETNTTASSAMPKPFAEKIQFSLIMSVSGGVIPSMAYVILRDKEERQKNKELEALSHEIRYVRSKILLLKQEKASQSLHNRDNRAQGTF